LGIRGLGVGVLLAGGAVLSACTGGFDWFASTPGPPDAEAPKPAAAPPIREEPRSTAVPIREEPRPAAVPPIREEPKPAAVAAIREDPKPAAAPAISSAAPSNTEVPKPAATAAIKMEDNCPTVDIRAGAGTLAVTDTVQRATASDVRYQLTFVQVARQCALSGQTVKMRVGVQGRAVAGPAGAPNQLEVPLRYAVVREGPEPKTITTKFKRLPVDLPPGTPNTVFTDIEDDLNFPLPPVDELVAYVVYVGFDEFGDRNDRRPPAKKGKAK
jgi:hypothetical protein